jgi:hypothetical protein
MVEGTQIAIPVTLIGIAGPERLVVLRVSVNQQSFNGLDANIKLTFCNHGQKAMDLGFLRHLLRKLAQSTRKKREMQHSQDAMKKEEVIV